MLARAFDATLAALVEAGYAVLVVVGFAQVLFRFVFESPLSWSEELIRYVFVWSVFLTAAIAFRLDLHPHAIVKSPQGHLPTAKTLGFLPPPGLGSVDPAGPE